MSLIVFSGAPQSNVGGFVFALLMVVLGIATTVGLLRRKRFGVIAFLGTYVLLLISSPLLDAIRNHPPSKPTGQEPLLLIFTIVTAIYLFKRWPLMLARTGTVVDKSK